MKAKKLGDYLLTSAALEAIKAAQPNFWRGANRFTALNLFQEGNEVKFGDRVLKALAGDLIDDVTDYPRQALSTERRIEVLKNSLARQIRRKKEETIGRMDTIIRDLTGKKAQLEAALDDPGAYTGVNIFGEIQSVSALESGVGQLYAYIEAYKEIKITEEKHEERVLCPIDWKDDFVRGALNEGVMVTYQETENWLIIMSHFEEAKKIIKSIEAFYTDAE